MIFKFDKYGNLIESDTEDTLVQYSSNVNTLYAQFEEIDLKEYVPYISFERSDGELSPYIAMAYSGNSVSYIFSNAWITEKSGVLKCCITLKQNDIVRKTANFNLHVVNSLSGREVQNVDTTILSSFEKRMYGIEVGVSELIENGAYNIRLIEDKTTSEVWITPKNYTDYTYSAPNIKNVKVILSNDIGQGYISGVNFYAPSTGTTFYITNNSDYNLKVFVNGLERNYISVAINNTALTSTIICDGINVFVYIRLTEKE